MIRRAQNEDLEKIKDLLSQVLSVHHEGRPDVFKANCRKYTDGQILSIISDEKTPVFVYEGEAGVLGYAFCVLSEIKGDNILCDAKTLYIDDICVDESARGLNVGRALCEHLKEFARGMGCTEITLNVWECNGGARRFYEKMGFSSRKTVMEYML